MPKSKFGLKFSLVLKIVLLISYQDPKFLFNYQLLILRYEAGETGSVVSLRRGIAVPR